MTNAEFFDLCKNHDWHFVRSNDSKVYIKGKQEMIKINDRIKQNPGFKNIYLAWENHIFNGYRKPDLKDFESSII